MNIYTQTNTNIFTGPFQESKNVYGAVIAAGYEYTIHLPNGMDFPGGSDGTTLEFSDTIYGDYFNKPDNVRLTIMKNDGTMRQCEVSSMHAFSAGCDSAVGSSCAWGYYTRRRGHAPRCPCLSTL